MVKADAALNGVGLSSAPVAELVDAPGSEPGGSPHKATCGFESRRGDQTAFFALRKAATLKTLPIPHWLPFHRGGWVFLFVSDFDGSQNGIGKIVHALLPCFARNVQLDDLFQFGLARLIGGSLQGDFGYV